MRSSCSESRRLRSLMASARRAGRESRGPCTDRRQRWWPSERPRPTTSRSDGDAVTACLTRSRPSIVEAAAASSPADAWARRSTRTAPAAPRHAPRDCSITRAAASASSSSHGRATTCTPTGRPSGVRCTGHRHGRVLQQVEPGGVAPGIEVVHVAPSTAQRRSPWRNAGIGATGQSSTGYSRHLLGEPRLQQVAANLDLQQPLGGELAAPPRPVEELDEIRVHLRLAAGHQRLEQQARGAAEDFPPQLARLLQALGPERLDAPAGVLEPPCGLPHGRACRRRDRTGRRLRTTPTGSTRPAAATAARDGRSDRRCRVPPSRRGAPTDRPSSAPSGRRRR